MGLAHKAYWMSARLPEKMRDILQREIQYEVSRRVMRILKPQKITQCDDLKRLSNGKLDFLKRLYRFAGKYENVFIVEQVQVGS